MNSIKIPKQTNLKNKLIIFLIFFSILSIITFGYAYELLNTQNVIHTVDNRSIIDGTDFTVVTNLFIGAFNGTFFVFTFIATCIINILIILIATLIFNQFYFKSICLEKEQFNEYIKNIIWGLSIIGMLIILFLNLDKNIATILFCVLLIYLPLPSLVQVLFTSKSKKVYKYTKENRES